MKKREFAQVIRDIQSPKTSPDEREQLLMMLCDDLGFIEVLAKLIPESEIKKLAKAPAEERLW